MIDRTQVAEALGCQGAWLAVGRAGLLTRTVRMPPGYYLLVWTREKEQMAIVWEEGYQGPDSRIPPLCWWLLAAHAWSPGDWFKGHVSKAFRAGQEFANREALLRNVKFHQGDGQFEFMECVGARVEWEW